MGISSTFRHLVITLAADAGSDFTPRWLFLPRMTSGNSITYLVFVCVSFLPAPPLLSLTTDTSVLWPVSPGFFFPLALKQRAAAPGGRPSSDHTPGSLLPLYSHYLHKLLRFCLNVKRISRKRLETFPSVEGGGVFFFLGETAADSVLFAAVKESLKKTSCLKSLKKPN